MLSTISTHGNSLWTASYPYKLINEFVTQTHKNMSMMDPLMVDACQKALGCEDAQKINSTAVMTTKLRGQWFSFATSIHPDIYDDIDKESLDKYRVLLSLSFEQYPPEVRKRVEYIRKFVEKFDGLCCPTTLNYKFLGSFHESEVAIMSFFLFPGMEVAMELEGGSTLQFYGSKVAHASSATLAVNNEMVYYESDTGSVLAWGRASSTKGKNNG